MLPSFDQQGNLPRGVHVATWAEIVGRFGDNARRRGLLEGLRKALEVLRSAGCARVYLDGSFVSHKATPGDYDVAWEPAGVDVELLLRLEPVFGIFDAGRAAQENR